MITVHSFELSEYLFRVFSSSAQY